jgi:phosphonate metabolism-associated iron-containing alcohol dehydrogenase
MAGDYSNPVQVESGWGCLDTLDRCMAGRRAILITTSGTRKRGVVGRVEAQLGGRLVAVWAEVEANPTIAACERAATDVSSDGDVSSDDGLVVIGLGGGSSLDTAKAVALQRTPGVDAGFLASFLRDGASLPEDFAPPPMILIPTTSGTGSEVTKWGTVWDERDGRKFSVSHDRLYPEHAIVDPELTLGLPEDTTVFTGLDALSHSMESIWNNNANPTSDAYAVEAIGLIHAALPRILAAPDSRPLRESLSRASLLAGLAFSNTATAIAHSISYPLTSSLGIPHGLACSLTLGEVLAFNAKADASRCQLIVEALGARNVAEAIETLYALFSAVRVGERLAKFAPTRASLDEVEGSFIAPGRAANNLAPIDHEGAARILSDAYSRLTR